MTSTFDDTDLNEVLTEISKLIDNTEFDDIIWIGDLNWDRARNSGFADTLDRFVATNNLLDVWDRFPVDFTPIYTDLKSTSTIDRILVNERLLNIITDAGVLHIGDNPSRHSPIYLKFDAGHIPRNKVTNEKGVKKPVWHKANEEQINEYIETLHENIRGINCPYSLNCLNVNYKNNSHSMERDGFMTDILCSIIQTSYSTIPLCSGRSQNIKYNCSVTKAIPGWR